MAMGERDGTNSKLTKLWEKKLSVPIEGVVISELHDEIWVRTRDYQRGPLVSFTFKGKKIGRFGQGAVTAPGTGICVDRMRDCISVTQTTRILILDRLGYKVKDIEVSDAGQLQGIVYCPGVDRYLITDTGRHCVWLVDATSGSGHVLIGEKHLLNSPGFLCRKEDTIVVSDSNNHQLKWFKLTGEFEKTSDTNLSKIGRFEFPQGVCFDQKGSLLICDQDNMRVLRVTTENDKDCYNVLLSSEQLDGLRPCCVDTAQGLLVVGLRGHKGRLVCFAYTTDDGATAT